jgi:AcrR family transcriptional regulator
VAAELDPRILPSQARAKATVARILETAARLLEEVGVDGFNTNLLAERAGVRVRSVYRYFPNKLAVIRALAERNAQKTAELFSRLPPLDEGQSIEAAVEATLSAFVDIARELPGRSAVRRAMQATPELRAFEREVNDRLAAQLASTMASRSTRPSAELEIVARTLIEAAGAILDLALVDDVARADRYLAELRVLLTAYVGASLR